jgi:hypothetical protein
MVQQRAGSCRRSSISISSTSAFRNDAHRVQHFDEASTPAHWKVDSRRDDCLFRKNHKIRLGCYRFGGHLLTLIQPSRTSWAGYPAVGPSTKGRRYNAGCGSTGRYYYLSVNRAITLDRFANAYSSISKCRRSSWIDAPHSSL